MHSAARDLFLMAEKARLGLGIGGRYTKIAPVETEARCATKNGGKRVEPLDKKIFGDRGNEVLAIDLFCRCVCGKSALCDCCCKDTARPIKFGGGGKRF
jgi:hypothetical protein